MDEEVDCPRCGTTASAEIENYEDGSLEIECENCGATLEVTYSVSIQIDGVGLSNVPAAKFKLSRDSQCTHLDSCTDIQSTSLSADSKVIYLARLR